MRHEFTTINYISFSKQTHCGKWRYLHFTNHYSPFTTRIQCRSDNLSYKPVAAHGCHEDDNHNKQ